METKKCGDCIHADVCEQNPLHTEFSRDNPAYCEGFKDKSKLVEVVHGRWNMDKLEMGNPYDGNNTMLVDIGNCSVCGHRCEMLPIMNYCPNCGAKMDGERRTDNERKAD
jgi:rubrerythrin